MLNNFHKIQNFRQFSNLFSQNWLKSDRRHSFLEFGTKSGKKFIKNSQKKCKNRRRKWKIGNSLIQSRKNVDDFWLKFWDWRTVQRSALCRSRRELSNEYLLAKIGVDTAENEPLEVWGKIIQYYSFVSLALTALAQHSSAVRQNCFRRQHVNFKGSF